MNEYGICWIETFGRQMQTRAKQKFFDTCAAREKFAARLAELENFVEFAAWSNPRSDA